jgi:hypothetical protein
MPTVDWKRFAFAALAGMLIWNFGNSYLGRRNGSDGGPAPQEPTQNIEVKVAASSQSADGVSEEQLSPQLADAMAKHAEERLVAKLQAIARQAGITRPAPQIQSQAVIVQAQGRKLVVIRYQIDGTARAVEVFGISGKDAHRVMCTRETLEEILVTVGPCADKIKEVHGVTLGAKQGGA